MGSGSGPNTQHNTIPPASRFLAEFLGTFGLVFAGTGAIIINDTTGGAVTHLGIAIVFGLIVMAMIYMVGDVSGAHINPAVSLAFALAGRLPATNLVWYIFAQCLGAIAASVFLFSLFPSHPSLGMTLPAGSTAQSFALEVVLTLFLMLVILAVATGSKEKGIMAGIAIGGIVGLEALFAGPISGASMNPARSLGPAVVAGDLGRLWVYLAAPTLGALAAVPVHRYLNRGS